jgi:hypothetical protein
MMAAARIDLGQVLLYVKDAKGTFGKEDDPLGYVAAVLEDVPLIVAELRELRDRMDRHHAYLSGLSGGQPCLICEHEGVTA